MLKLVSRPRLLALAVVLAAGLVLPASALADTPAGAAPDRDAPVGSVVLGIGAQTWLAQVSVNAALGPSATNAAPSTLVPSDGKVHRVNIGGRRLAIWCKGVGSPTVILEHGIGYGVDSDSWSAVLSGVAKETRVCRYDRAYVGESDDAKPGRSMPDLAEDLVELMEAARITGPYIIVGHSFGGLSARYFTLLHPRSVVGMVLVDGSPPSAITNLDLGSERLNRPKVLSQLKQLKSLGRIPLVVITRGIGVSAAWRDAQEDLVELSTSSRHVIATHSDHWIQLRQPDLVIREILTVLHTLRRRQG